MKQSTPKSVAGHTSLTTVKNFQFTKLAGWKKENNEAAEPATSRSTGPYTDSTARGQKESAEDVEQRHRN